MEDKFWFGVQLENLLIYGINTTSWQGLLGACTCTALFAFLYEAMRGFRDSLMSKSSRTASVINSNGLKIVETCRQGWPLHLIQTVLHFFHLSVGYLLMLLAMTYNGYLAIALLIGAAVGYFISSFIIWPTQMMLNVNQRSSIIRTSGRIDEDGSLLGYQETMDGSSGTNGGSSTVPVLVHQEARGAAI